MYLLERTILREKLHSVDCEVVAKFAIETVTFDSRSWQSTVDVVYRAL